MHTAMNIYICNLALADVIIAVFCIPFQFQAALLHRWDLPHFMCKLCPFLQVSHLFSKSTKAFLGFHRFQLLMQHLSINASIYSLVVIALDRYRGIVWPLRGAYSKLRAKVNVLLIWVVSVTIAFPNLMAFHVSKQYYFGSIRA